MLHKLKQFLAKLADLLLGQPVQFLAWHWHRGWDSYNPQRLDLPNRTIISQSTKLLPIPIEKIETTDIDISERPVFIMPDQQAEYSVIKPRHINGPSTDIDRIKSIKRK